MDYEAAETDVSSALGDRPNQPAKWGLTSCTSLMCSALRCRPGVIVVCSSILMGRNGPACWASLVCGPGKFEASLAQYPTTHVSVGAAVIQ